MKDNYSMRDGWCTMTKILGEYTRYGWQKHGTLAISGTCNNDNDTCEASINGGTGQFLAAGGSMYGKAAEWPSSASSGLVWSVCLVYR